MKKAVIPLIFALSASIFAESVAIRPSQPTHYFYSPTPYVNRSYDLVLGLHEIAFTLPAKLELEMSLVDNVGRVNFGAKYGLMSNLAIGAGMAWSFISSPNGGHAILHYLSPRLGAYLCYGLTRSKSFEAAITPSIQIGDHTSAGVDFALMGTPSDVWSIIWEVGSSFDFNDALFYVNTDGGIRIHPPKIRFLNFDLGIDLVETCLNEYHPHVAPYFDLIFAMRTK